ncbi:hypothetical protein M9458_042668, partial [Cirrhinus mrigala]
MYQEVALSLVFLLCRIYQSPELNNEEMGGPEACRLEYCRVGFSYKLNMESISVEELSCPVCCEIFSHSICKERKNTRESSKSDPPGNLVLKNLCESFLNTEEVCDLHGEKLKLFCVEDKG